MSERSTVEDGYVTAEDVAALIAIICEVPSKIRIYLLVVGRRI